MDEDPISAMCAAHGPIVSDGRFPIGTIFGDWRVTAFIGRGGNGEVYCAEHVALGTSAAVKVLVRDEQRAKERFTREAKLLSQLKSKSFPQFYSYGEANGCAYLAMELLEPGELPTGDKNAARFLLSICDAVAELHSRGYIHRDIKPGNILWRDAIPVLADLGLAKTVGRMARAAESRPLTGGSGVPPLRENQTETRHGVGTPGYGAPEQVERGEATVSSDIHALGVLADACFRGKPPRTWARIIRRATSSIPAHRYPSVAAFARAIRWRHLRRATLFGMAIAFPLALASLVFCDWWMRGGDEAWAWRAMCSRGEIVSIEERNEPLNPDQPYPAIVRHATNRVEGVIVQLPARTNVFARPIRLNPGEYRVVGPGRLDADLSGPSNVVVRLKDCILNNMTEVPYPQNGIRYVLEGGVYLNFARLDKGILPIKHVVIEDGAENAVRFRGPTIISELRDLQWLEEKRSWEDSQRQIP